jgi:hypothetical protein
VLNDSQMAETAIKAVADVQQSRGTTDLHVRSKFDCFGGKLLTVAGRFADDKARFENYVFFNGDNWEHTFNTLELVKRLDSGMGDPRSLRTLRSLFGVGAIAGIIALAMTATIIVIVARHPDVHVPDILANALTTILGFYFGSQVNRPLGK